jgi:hypothetical protein
MIEDKENGIKIAENSTEKFLLDSIEKTKKLIENTEVDLTLNQKFLEFDLKQQRERLEFLEKELSN